MTTALFYVHTVAAQPYLGTRANAPGGAWDTSRTVACWVEEGTKLVRDSDGNETVSSARVFAALADRGSFVVGSRVTLPSGRVSRVLALAVHDSGSLALGLDHIEADLT